MVPTLPIYIDFDDCLSQTAITLLNVVKKEFKKEIPYEAIVSFNLEKSFNLTSEEWTHLMGLAHSTDVLLKMEPVQGAPQALKKLKDKGHTIHIVTGRPPTTRQQSEDWLKTHDTPYDEIFFVDKYFRFDQHNDYTMTLKELTKKSYLFAVEDSGTMAQFVSEQMNTLVFLLDRPWNRNATSSNYNTPIVRCQGWAHLLTSLQDHPFELT